MTLQHRKKRNLDRTAQVRDADLVVIATEGERTEKQYFDMFRSKRVKVEVIPTEDGKSSPKHVLERLDRYKREYQIGEGDSLWFMSDVDRWPKKQFSEIMREADQKGYQLAISNPCFECWLCLHFADIKEEKMNKAQVTALLKKHLGGYNKANIDVEKFRGNAGAAVRRAKALDEGEERWPSGAGSHVYKVVEEILRRMADKNIGI